MKIKVAIIHNIVSPYRIPIFKELSNNPLIDLTVLYCAKTHKNRKWEIDQDRNYNYRFLSGICIDFSNITYHINYEIIPILLKKKFDVVIIGGCSDFTTQIAFLYSKLFKIPIILWSEGIDNPKGLIGKIVYPLFQFIITHSTAIIVPGTRSKQYHLKAGAKESTIFIAPNIVDNDFFISHSNHFKQEKEQIKKEMNIEGKKIILFVGRLVKQKGISDLILAYLDLKKRFSNIVLIIVGDGPLLNEFKQNCKELSNQDIIFTGWRDGKEKVKYYSIADIFVLPTLSDVWGLVINEAMCCELPIITTSTAGSSVDMVFDGKNGYIIEPKNCDALADAIHKIIQKNEGNKMGLESKKIILTHFTIKDSVNGFMKAIQYSCKNFDYPTSNSVQNIGDTFE